MSPAAWLLYVLGAIAVYSLAKVLAENELPQLRDRPVLWLFAIVWPLLPLFLLWMDARSSLRRCRNRWRRKRDMHVPWPRPMHPNCRCVIEPIRKGKE